MLEWLISRVRLILATIGLRLPSALEMAKAIFRNPTVKQMESAGRYLHTISSASLIGSFTVLVAGKWSWWTMVQVPLLLGLAVLLFIVGFFLSRGE